MKNNAEFSVFSGSLETYERPECGLALPLRKASGPTNLNLLGVR